VRHGSLDDPVLDPPIEAASLFFALLGLTLGFEPLFALTGLRGRGPRVSVFSNCLSMGSARHGPSRTAQEESEG
jgi:hypothetical protein